MKHIKLFESMDTDTGPWRTDTHKVYYTQFSDYTKEEQDELRECTDAQQNGYADIICVGEDVEEDDIDSPDLTPIDRILLKYGYSIGDEVIVHYTW